MILIKVESVILFKKYHIEGVCYLEYVSLSIGSCLLLYNNEWYSSINGLTMNMLLMTGQIRNFYFLDST